MPNPEPAGRTAAVVLIHGGGFVDGSKTMAWYPNIARQLASEGWAAFSINYCLPRQSPGKARPGYPVEVQDVEAAVRSLARHAGAYHVDPSKIVLWGGSAGATLAVDVGTAVAHSQRLRVAATVGWSGGYDFLDLRGASAHSVSFVRDYLGCNPVAPVCRDTAAMASAALTVTPAAPPSILANSTAEQIPGVPLYQLKDMARALANARVRAKTLIMLGSRHAVAYTETAYCPTVRFLERFVGPITGSCIPPAPPVWAGRLMLDQRGLWSE